MKTIEIMDIDLRMFDEVINLTTSPGLSDAMKTFYSDYLIDNAEPELVHDQWAQTHDIPKNGGKTIEFRRYSPLAKALTPLSEGVTPDGNSLSVSVITATIEQFGDYIKVSDILQLSAIDNQLMMATELLGSQAGRTLDTITREVLAGGNNRIFAGGALARHLLVGGSSTAANNHYLNVDAIKKAARFLKVMNAAKIDGDYVAIIHPDVAYDLTNDSAWMDPHKYVDTENLYRGEIGKIHGVRVVETTEAKKIVAPPLIAATDSAEAVRNLSIAATLQSAGKTVTLNETLTEAQATALVGRKIILANKQYTIKSATATVTGGSPAAASLTVADTDDNISTTDGVKDAVIYPGEAGAEGRDVYAVIVLAKNAYGTTKLTGGGLEHIYKPLGSGGSSDPLNQRATVGWKATKVTKRLVEEFMVRIECTSTFNDHEPN
jgi:N4-gp56 family major capsid protein